jgi:hypothetical protein
LTDKNNMQHPQLYLGLMGFDGPSEAAVKRWLAANAVEVKKNASPLAEQRPIWQAVNFREADALLIRGAGVVQGFGQQLQFNPALRLAQPLAPLGVELDSLKLPFAISDISHLTRLGIEVKDHATFDLSSAANMLHTLQHLETLLRPLRTLFSLAIELTERREELDGGHTFHLERNGGLDAIIDPPNRRVLLRPGTRPVDIEADSWLRRPKSANFAPSHFMECGMDEVAWVFAMHCTETDLPKRYLSKPIHMRHNPRVRTSLLYPRHAALLDRLWQGPATLEQLQKDLPASAHLHERDLFGLYLTRSISTSAGPGVKNNDDVPASGAFDTTGKWMLKSVGQRMNTMTGELQSLF